MTNWIVDNECMTLTAPEVKPHKRMIVPYVSTTASSDYVWPMYLNYRHRNAGINELMADQILRLDSLGDNWDKDGAIAPSTSTIALARRFVLILGIVGQEVYNVGPGPLGEILVDLRKGDRSIEFLFYPTRVTVVQFSNNQRPIQQEFSSSILPNLLQWLNAK